MDCGSFDWIILVYVKGLMAVYVKHGKISQGSIKTVNFMTS